jgi:DHA2 family methylenomycin A resistance protein-like MFS transporter
MSKLYSANAFVEWIPAVATGAAFFMIVLDTSIVNLALASIGAELSAGLTTLQGLVDGYALVFASLLLGAGALGDRFGAKGIFMCGLAVFTLASVLCGIAPNIEALQISRIVQGIGAALLVPNSLAALNNAYAGSLNRPKAIAAWASSGALGVALGPVLGGLLVQALGWRSIFIVNVPVGLLALWLTRCHIPQGPRNRSRAFDAAGQLLAVGTLATATYALIDLSHARSGIVSFYSSGAVCVGLVIGFIVVEARHPSPMLPLPLLRRRTLGPVALVGLLHNVSFFGLIFVLSLSFQRLRGLSPVGAGLLFLPLTLAFGTGTRVGAMLLRNYGPFLALIRGHFVAAIGCCILASFGQRLTPAALILPLIVIGAGAGITTPAMNLAVLDSVEPTQGGLASGILYSARQTGGVIGVALLGALLGEPATSAGAKAAEYTAAGVLCLASALALAASKNWRATPTTP